MTIFKNDEGETSIWIPDITATCTIYAVCNRTKYQLEGAFSSLPAYGYEFAGTKVEMSFISGDEGDHNSYLKYDATLEIVKSTTPVKKLTDEEKAEYISF